MTENGLIEGHEACADHLQNLVDNLLLEPDVLDHNAQELLLAKLQPVVTDNDNAACTSKQG